MSVLPFPAARTAAVDQDGETVFLWGVPIFKGTQSNASRAAAALEELVRVGLLTPRGRLRAGLQASIAELGR